MVLKVNLTESINVADYFNKQKEQKVNFENNNIVSKIDNGSIQISLKENIILSDKKGLSAGPAKITNVQTEKEKSYSINGSQLYELQVGSTYIPFFDTEEAKRQLSKVSIYSDNELKNIQKLYDLFHYQTIKAGFKITQNPFVHEDYLHNQNPNCPDVFQCQYINVDLLHNHIIEIMMNNKNQLVIQYIEENEDNEIINEKLQRFDLLSKNDINQAINHICDLLSFNNDDNKTINVADGVIDENSKETINGSQFK